MRSTVDTLDCLVVQGVRRFNLIKLVTCAQRDGNSRIQVVLSTDMLYLYVITLRDGKHKKNQKCQLKTLNQSAAGCCVFRQYHISCRAEDLFITRSPRFYTTHTIHKNLCVIPLTKFVAGKTKYVGRSIIYLPKQERRQ